MTTSEILKNVPVSSVKQATFTLLYADAPVTSGDVIDELLKLIVTELSVIDTIELCDVLIPAVAAPEIVI